MKFKVGDKVVIVEIISKKDLPLGTIATIKELQETEEEIGRYDPSIFLAEDSNENNWYSKCQLELEHEYNSPLNKALR